MKTFKIIIGLIVVIILMVVLYGIYQGMIQKSEDKNAIITGAKREGFIEGSMESCSETLKKENKYTDVQVNNYCSCSTNNSADVLTNADIDLIKRQGAISDDIQAKIITAQATCLSSLQK